MKVEIYADVVCPWCYVGEKRFEEARRRFGGDVAMEIVFRPYQLDPQAPREARPIADYLSQKFGAAATSAQQHVTAAAESAGITINWDRALAANTFDAHRLMLRAREQYEPSVHYKLIELLFAAHFTDGKDVSSIDVLVDLAERAGMDAEEARTYLASESGVDDLRYELQQAHATGVTSVPTFVFEEQYVVQGAHPPEVFVQVLTKLQEMKGQ